jgi:hypothetical protein
LGILTRQGRFVYNKKTPTKRLATARKNPQAMAGNPIKYQTATEGLKGVIPDPRNSAGGLTEPHLPIGAARAIV